MAEGERSCSQPTITAPWFRRRLSRANHYTISFAVTVAGSNVWAGNTGGRTRRCGVGELAGLHALSRSLAATAAMSALALTGASQPPLHHDCITTGIAETSTVSAMATSTTTPPEIGELPHPNDPRWRELGYDPKWPTVGHNPKWQSFGYDPKYKGFQPPSTRLREQASHAVAEHRDASRE